MGNRCPLCKKEVDEKLVKTCVDAERWVIEQIRKRHPDWVISDGGCPKCLEYYRGLGKNE